MSGALLTLARDVLVAASRRRTLWYYLIASTAVVGVLVLGADLSIELRRDEPAGPLPRTVALGQAVLPGSVSVRAGEGGAWLDAHDDGGGHLGDGSRGQVDYARGIVTVAARDAAQVEGLTVSYAVSLVGLAADARARALDQGLATRFTLFGQTFDDRRLPPAHAAPYQLTLFLFNGLLIRVVASFFGVILGLLAMNDAVSSALEPGAAELLLSRPVGRHEVVLGRALGALAFALVQVGWLLGLALALCGLKFGVWVPEALLLAAPMLLKFAVLLGVATLVAVATRTPALGLAAAVGAWVASFAVYQLQASAGLVPPAAADALAWAYWLVPQVAHLDDLASRVAEIPLDGGAVVPWQQALALAGAWVGATFGATTLVVRRRDY